MLLMISLCLRKSNANEKRHYPRRCRFDMSKYFLDFRKLPVLMETQTFLIEYQGEEVKVVSQWDAWPVNNFLTTESEDATIPITDETVPAIVWKKSA